MCFFNSQNKRALEIAKRYGRKSDIVEMAREILEEQKRERTGELDFQHRGTETSPLPPSKGGYEFHGERQSGEVGEMDCFVPRNDGYKEERAVQKAFMCPDCLIVTHDEQLQVAKWGLVPFWVRNSEQAASIRKVTANARSETAFTQASFRNAIRKRRCIVPSTGFFEYHHEGKEAIPYKIFLPDSEVFSLAGIYEEWITPATNEMIRTFAVLTVPANELCGFIHNGGMNPGRMPAILSVEDENTWLSPELTEREILALLRPYETSIMDSVALEKDYLRRA